MAKPVILIANDEPDVLVHWKECVQHFLDAKGLDWDIVTVSPLVGKKLRQKVDQCVKADQTIALFLMDQEMGMSRGTDYERELRINDLIDEQASRMPYGKDVPVVIVSGGFQDNARFLQGKEDGNTLFSTPRLFEYLDPTAITKPVSQVQGERFERFFDKIRGLKGNAYPGFP